VKGSDHIEDLGVG